MSIGWLSIGLAVPLTQNEGEVDRIEPKVEGFSSGRDSEDAGDRQGT